MKPEGMSAQAVLRRVSRSAALVVAAACAGACGDEGSSSPPRAPTGLPTKQFQLAYDLCPTAGEASSAQARRTRAMARRQLARLAEAYRDDADARVRSSFEAANEAGPQYEDLTLRELVRRHLQGVAEVAEVGDAPARRCALGLRARLQALLRG
jgi:hypothetical protein